MTSYTVQGTFPTSGNPATPSSYLPSLSLSGTIDMGGGIVTAMDIVIPDFPLHFTQIYFNEFFNGSYLLSGQTPGSCGQRGCQEDYLTFSFTALPFSEGGLLNFTQAKILNGAVVHNTYFPDGTSSTIYHGLGLQGTICPLDGCAPFPIPIKAVSGPVAGADLPGLLVVALIIFGGFCWKRQTREKTDD